MRKDCQESCNEKMNNLKLNGTLQVQLVRASSAKPNDLTGNFTLSYSDPHRHLMAYSFIYVSVKCSEIQLSCNVDTNQ